MELHARLVHAEAGLRVVEVRASRGDQSLGSAVAEAATAHAAEDLAIARLLQRLQQLGAATTGDRQAAAAPRPAAGSAEVLSQPSIHRVPKPVRAAAPQSDPAGGRALTPASPGAAAASLAAGAEPVRQVPPAQPTAGTPPHSPPIQAGAAAPAPAPWPATPTATTEQLAAGATEPVQPVTRSGPASEASATSELSEAASALPLTDPQEEPLADPEDWSQELTGVDLQLRRLGWSREQEGLYLLRAFGHPSRSRLTRYSDLRAYLVALEGLQPGSDPSLAAVPLRRSELLAQGDALLRQLGWSAEQGRAFLERQLERVSRQQLSDVQLLQFNMLLEGQLLAGDAAAGTAALEGAQR